MEELFPIDSQRRIVLAVIELFERQYGRDNQTYQELTAIYLSSFNRPELSIDEQAHEIQQPLPL